MGGERSPILFAPHLPPKVAQANGVNPNVLFLWRRQHREGRLAVQEGSPMRLLPVTVMDSSERSESSAGEPASPGSA
jgi:transposase-like protein